MKEEELHSLLAKVISHVGLDKQCTLSEGIEASPIRARDFLFTLPEEDKESPDLTTRNQAFCFHNEGCEIRGTRSAIESINAILAEYFPDLRVKMGTETVMPDTTGHNKGNFRAGVLETLTVLAGDTPAPTNEELEKILDEISKKGRAPAALSRL